MRLANIFLPIYFRKVEGVNMNIDKERILKEAEDDFIEALSNREYVNPYEAGHRAAKYRILNELATAYKVVNPVLLPLEGRQTVWELWVEFDKRHQNER